MRKETQKSYFCECFGKRVILPGLFFLFSFCAYATDDIGISHEIVSKYQMVEELKKEIAQIDSESARCQKMKNGWIAATVVGGVGVVATGTAVIIQGSKLKDKPKTDAKSDNKPETTTGSETAEQ